METCIECRLRGHEQAGLTQLRHGRINRIASYFVRTSRFGNLA